MPAGLLAATTGAPERAAPRRRAELERGASVADVGCGHSASAVLIARAFPRSRITGFDYHEGSVAFARAAAARAGVSANKSA